MASTYGLISTLAHETAKEIVRSKDAWAKYLQSAARHYKRSFKDQILIFAQRPDATACASIEEWNDKFRNWVNRGAKGIALIDDTGITPKLKYVFDVSDVHKYNGLGREVKLWRMNTDLNDQVLKMLTKKYHTEEVSSFDDKIIKIAEEMALEISEELTENMKYLKADSFLEDLDDINLSVRIRETLSSSIAFTVLSRCDYNVDSIMDKFNFDYIHEFNTIETLSLLGDATAALAKPVLIEIGKTIERNEKTIEKDKNIYYNPLKHESENEIDKIASERGNENGNNISEERGLPGTRSQNGRAAGGNSDEIRATKEEIPTGEQKGSLQQFSSLEQAHEPLVGNPGSSGKANGTSDRTNETERGNHRSAERGKSDTLDTENEQHITFGGGDSPERDNIQLTLFPTLQQQIEAIEIGARKDAPFSMEKNESNTLAKYSYIHPKVEPVPVEYILDVLKRGTGFEHGKFRIEEIFKQELSSADRIKAIRKEFGQGGAGWRTDDFGLHGYDTFNSKGLSCRWKDAEGEKEGYVTWTKVENLLRHLVLSESYITQKERDKYDHALLIAARIELMNPGDIFTINNEKYEFVEKDFLGRLEVKPLDEKNELYFTVNDGCYIHDFSLERYDFEIDEPGNVEDIPQPKIIKENISENVTNFVISNDISSTGGAKDKFRRNIEAIKTLLSIERETRTASPAEQEILSHYAGWGGLADAFDEHNKSWANEYQELKLLLTEDEYTSARESTLNSHYTSPGIIKLVYDNIRKMGFKNGNIIDPGLGIGNYFGMLPEEMKGSKLYGVEIDHISGRIAKQLYPTANIQISGFEKTAYPNDFFDLAIGNVPFGQYKVSDRNYDKHNFLIHDYFFAKAIDKVRPGGIIAFITSKGTMDKKSPEVRKYIAQRAELLGAVRLPNTAFKQNAGTEVTSDILFLKKRDRAIDIEPEWIHLSENEDGIAMNQYFADNPNMVVGKMKMVSGPYGMESTCEPNTSMPFLEQLDQALQNIGGSIDEIETAELDDAMSNAAIPADPDVKNFSYTVRDGQLYYRENSVMVPIEVSTAMDERIKALVKIRDCTYDLITYQLEEYGDLEIRGKQAELNILYDSFGKKFGLINSQANKRAFSQDSSYFLLCSLEVLNDDGSLKRKADMFTKRTIKKQEVVTSVDTANEALLVSLSEKAKVDLDFMRELTGMDIEKVISDLQGVIFKNPITEKWETADEYLSGDVRNKLKIAKEASERDPDFAINVFALEGVQPEDLTASDIEVRLGATWIDPQYVNDFMRDVFKTPRYMIDRNTIGVLFSPSTGDWNIKGKSADTGNSITNMTFGTARANAYKILEDSLNLRDTRIFDTTIEDGKEVRVLNKKETLLAGQKQDAIKEEFKNWIFKDPERREVLCTKYNELFNSTRPREYNGAHLYFPGMNPLITLDPHQKNAVARGLYGRNTLLAHCVGAGKTFEMTATAMESKRLGLSNKSLFVVPNHLTEQWASDFLKLYPGANILAATKKDFEPANRKKFCSRIATGDYDAIIIGHTQFEKIPLSVERQRSMIRNQINEISQDISSIKEANGERYTIKQMEKTKKSLEVRFERLNDASKKDDVVTFEQLGVDHLYVDESHSFKNLYLYTKMRNVAGISQTEAKKSSDMFAKCQYLDEITDGKGITFATGTPISNSMTELYTNMRYLQYSTLQKLGLLHFDSWAADFGETTTAIELAPEGTGYRAKTRFAKFFNLPELINLFKEVADIQTPDMLKLPVPEVEYTNVVLKPSEVQQDMVKSLADRAEVVRNRQVDASVDNMLKITNDGRKLALDQRLINDLLPDNDNSKVNACVNQAYKIWEDTRDSKSTQLIFCDLSTPKGDGKFNVYDDIKSKLIEKGVPEHEIAFIHDANTEIRKAALFANVRSGKVRFLLGSTAKMGAGTNVQDKLIALHHLDVPWRPSDIEQQEGRILRQGNENPKVQIYRYITEGTFDSYSWQLIENKQKFIGQIMTSKSPVRSCDDIDEAALSYAEVKALATGNPYIREKMDLDIKVSKLKLLKANHMSQKYQLEDNIIKHYPNQISVAKEHVNGYMTDIKTYTEKKAKGKDEFKIIIGGKEYREKKDAGAALIEQCKNIKAANTLIGEYQGFPMRVNFDSFDRKLTVSFKGQLNHNVEVSADPIGNITRFNNLLDNMPDMLHKYEEKLENVQNQLQNAKEEVTKEFPREKELSESVERLAALNALLNMDEKDNSGLDFEEAEEGNQELSEGDPTSREADAPVKVSMADRMAAAKEEAIRRSAENVAIKAVQIVDSEIEGVI